MTEKFSITRKGENPYLRPYVWIMQPEEAAQHPAVKKITHGEGVRWLQWELCEAGYPVSVDACLVQKQKLPCKNFRFPANCVRMESQNLKNWEKSLYLPEVFMYNNKVE